MHTLVAVVRSAVGITVMAINTIYIGVVATTIARFNPRSTRITGMIHFWARLFHAIIGVKLRVEGQENIDPARSYVFVSNHQSNIDIPSHFLACRNPLRFLAKKELFKVPILGYLLRHLDFIEVDRQAHASAHRDINLQVERTVSLGHSLIIYPEGTRTRDGNLKPFKKGAFRIAIDNGMDIIPMATSSGSRRAWPPGSKFVRPATVRVKVAPPISVAGLTGADVDRVRKEAEATVHKLFDEVNQS
ncbi:MAG: 1-acyl-sn-glycerol-3-phosphate acyltransferase [Acidimicrobiia bacterium]|nr:1-acyl-sn-glycerol-3-phosphate acyltransferase [Acidimicrobiia bacterium]